MLLEVDATATREAEALASKGVNGNSRASTKAQHGYEIIDTVDGTVAKTGVSGGKRTVDGGSYRANAQANKWNKEPLVERIADRAEAYLARHGYGPHDELDEDPDDAQLVIHCSTTGRCRRRPQRHRPRAPGSKGADGGGSHLRSTAQVRGL